MKKQLATVLALSLVSSSAFAIHSAGDVFVRTGPILVVPNTDTTNQGSKNIMPYDFDVSSNAQLGLTGTYMATDHIGIELLAATPFSHEIKLAQLGDKTIAKTKQLPPTLSAQWYFLDSDSPARPYVGVGLNYTKFFHEKEKLDGLTDLHLKQSWGPAVNAGLDIGITDNLFFNTSLWYARIKSKVTFKLAGQDQKADVKLNPMIFFMGVGYRF